VFEPRPSISTKAKAGKPWNADSYRLTASRLRVMALSIPKKSSRQGAKSQRERRTTGKMWVVALKAMARESEVYAKWSLEMTRSGLFRPGERVGVAVSGGGDSILLLDFMTRFALKSGLRLAAVHFNHHLRGAESDADESFVQELA